MINAVSPASDPYKGSFQVYKKDFELFPSSMSFKHPGVKGPPEKRTLDAPPVLASVTTDRKKTNAQIVYTRVVPFDIDICAEFCVFVSRNKSTCTDRISMVSSLDLVNKMLREEEDATLSCCVNPRDDWRKVKTLREWTLDGILLGLDNEANASHALNICIAGHCPVRNVFDNKSIYIMDVCYLILVATRENDVFRFQYIPCTTRSLSEAKLVGNGANITSEQLRMAVGGWRLGRVMDTTAVRNSDQHSLTLDVRIEWVGWRSMKMEYPDSRFGDGLPNLEDGNMHSSCILFYWPTFVGTRQADELSTPKEYEMNSDEIRLNKHVIQDERKRGPVARITVDDAVVAEAEAKRPRYVGPEDDDLMVLETSRLFSDAMRLAYNNACTDASKITQDKTKIFELEKFLQAGHGDITITGQSQLINDINHFGVLHAEVISNVKAGYVSTVGEPLDANVCKVIYLIDAIKWYKGGSVASPEERAIEDDLLLV